MCRRTAILVTIDTNILPADDLVAATEALGVELSVVGTTRREVRGTAHEVCLRPLKEIDETGFWNAKGRKWNSGGVWGSRATGAVLEEILAIITDGSFPSVRASLTPGQQKQLNDASILEAHIRHRRHVFVTDDRKAFINLGRRERLAAAFRVRIMTRAEFLAACESGSLLVEVRGSRLDGPS